MHGSLLGTHALGKHPHRQLRELFSFLSLSPARVYSHAHKHHASLNSADYPHRKIKASKSGERTHRHHQRGALIWSARLPLPPLFSPWYVRESNLAFGRGLESNLPPPPLPPLLMMNQLANQSRMCIRYTPQQTHTYTGSHANLRGRTNKTKEMRDARAYVAD